jgi:hypothetical protein
VARTALRASLEDDDSEDDERTRCSADSFSEIGCRGWSRDDWTARRALRRVCSGAQSCVSRSGSCWQAGRQGTHVNADVLVENLAVVERHLLELLEAALELAELRQPTAALVLDVRLNLADPLALELDALSNNLLLEPG